MLPATIMKGFFQLGYVTSDLDQAIVLYGERFGVKQFLTFDSRAFNPDAERIVRVGLAWTGEVMIELIEPVGEHPLYACALPQQGFGIQLHHLGYLVRDQAQWEAALAALSDPATPIVVRSDPSDMLEYAYADARGLVGHHVEIVWLKPTGEAFFESVPRN
ncbi:MAG: hypothetical protein JWQ97_2644 [Phenylobacterium sp.]|nr:hypothetical protein [Phenylobacterium sp.]